MSTTSPNLFRAQIVDPIPYSAVDGQWPNPEAYVKSEIERIVGQLKAGFQSDDAAIVAYVNAQFTQVNALISGLAGGEDLQAALVTLNNLKGIVDDNGDGILDALGPLQTRLNQLEATVPALQGSVSAQSAAIAALSTELSGLSTSVEQNRDNVSELQIEVEGNQAAIQAIANNLGRNLQAIRNGLQQVNVNYAPIELPAPVFATTNVTGDSGTSPTDPDNL